MATTKAIKNRLFSNIKHFYRGRSMGSTFRPGDFLVIEKPASIGDYHPGDIIVFRPPDADSASAKTVHRIVRATDKGFVTRGDLNPRNDDGTIGADEIAGRVTGFERGGRVRKVRGGRWGLGRARVLWARLVIWRTMTAPIRPLYRRLRRSGLVGLLWKPDFRRVNFCSPDGNYVKYLFRGRTVAVWRPARNECRFRKPFDLVLWKKIVREQNERHGDGAAPEARGTKP